MDLTPQDEHRIRAADGWVDLDEALEAVEELEAIPIESRSHPAVMLQYCRIYLDTHRPHYTHLIASSLTKHLPAFPDGWFYLACAHARLNQKVEASAALQKCFAVAGNFRREWEQRAGVARDLDLLWSTDEND